MPERLGRDRRAVAGKGKAVLGTIGTDDLIVSALVVEIC